MFYKIKKIIFQSNKEDGMKLPFYTDRMMFINTYYLNLKNNPFIGTIFSLPPLNIIAILFGITFVSMPIFSDKSEDSLAVLLIFWPLSFLIGALILLPSAISAFITCKIKIIYFVVVVTQKLFFYTVAEFSENLNKYTHIDVFSRMYNLGRESITLHFIALIHPQTSLSVPLLISRSPPSTLLVTDYARALNMPVLERRLEGAVTLSPEDWVSTLREKALKGLIDEPQQRDWNPPSELIESHSPDELVINLAGRPLASRAGPLIAASIIVLPLLFLGWLLSPLVLLLGLGGLGLAGAIVYYSEMPRRLVITRSEVKLDNVGFGTWWSKWSLPHHEILSVQVVDDKEVVEEPVLLIWTKKGQLQAGQGLSIATPGRFGSEFY
jgi:hypothetical protein